MDDSREVWITGLGMVSPLGLGAETAWNRLLAGESGLAPASLRTARAEHPQVLLGRVPGFDADAWCGAKEARRMDPFEHFAVAASRLALQDAGLAVTDENRYRIGVCLGVALGGMGSAQREMEVYRNQGGRKISPYVSIAVFLCGPAGFVSIDLGIQGWSNVVSTCGASGLDAIGIAGQAIREGHADAILAGGTEAPLTEPVFAGLESSGALAPVASPDGHGPSCPFDRRRRGFVLSEGAGVVLLEAKEHAVRRGARPYASLRSYASRPGGRQRRSLGVNGPAARDTTQEAIERAGVRASDIGWFCANAASEIDNDGIESESIWQAYRGRPPVVGSLKGALGHALGASGGFQAVTAAMALRKRIVPPTTNYRDADRGLPPLDIPVAARSLESPWVEVQSLGYTGSTAALVLAGAEA